MKNDKYDDLINFLVNRRIKNVFTDSYTHVATFVPCNKIVNLNKIKIGANSNRIRYNNKKIKTHAEINALSKINFASKNNCVTVDLIVLRINKSHCLCDSAPCYHCTCELKKKSFININKIYYSMNDGTIKCVRFDDWINKCDQHISKGWKNIENIN
jgi:hypothetical protein